jgi:hypothetical protein
MEMIVNWKRILMWSLLIFTSALLVGLLLGEGILATAGVFASSTVLYYFFVRPLPTRRLRHLAAAFLLVEAIDWIVPMTLGAPLSYMLDNWGSSAMHLGAALLGLILARLSPENAFKPPPLRGVG